MRRILRQVEQEEHLLPLAEERRLYWAYGSNLCVADMARRCPRAKKHRRLYVGHGLLIFRGVADVTPSEDPASRVAGGLWLITRECERALDAYEGVSGGLYTKEHFEWEGKKVLFYKMRSQGVMPPFQSYLDTIARGYADFGLDLEHLREAVRRSARLERRTPHLEARWERRGRPALARSLED